MSLKHLLVRCGWLLVLSAAAARAGVISDPQMGVEAGDLSQPITTGVNFIPNSGGGVFGFYNGTGQIITELVFQTTILSGLNLTQDQINGVFTCNAPSTSGHPNPFFLDCSVGYVNLTGLLTISFYGVYPPDGDELPTDPFPQANEVGEQEGIPPILPGCSSNPDSDACRDVGHFLITLNTDFAVAGASGGWSNTATPGIFTPSGPTFTVAEVDAAPEPSPAILLAPALLCLVGIARKARRA